MALPLARQGFIVESLNQAETGWSGKHGNVFPLLVPLQDFPGGRRELLVDTAVFLDAPHVILCLYHLWYGKLTAALRHCERRAATDRECGKALPARPLELKLGRFMAIGASHAALARRF